MQQGCQLTVVIPTLASAGRAASLRRAIRSIGEQDVDCRIIAVVNGSRRDDMVVSALNDDPAVHLVSIAEGDLVKALAAGVAAVDTPLYCVLDDDDMLLPGACGQRIAYMAANPAVDVLVTQGERRGSNGSVNLIPDFQYLDEKDLIGSLLSSNWLASCGGVYRRSSIGPDAFAAMPRYLEWTYLAFQLARKSNVRFLPDGGQPHFAVFETYPSESATLDYIFTMPANVARLREEPLPVRVERLVSEKISQAAHTAASRALANGMLAAAWKFHLESVRERGGLKYLSFTRHLLLAALWPRQATG